jgi:quercetin dioxygenase-like cupin family protein
MIEQAPFEALAALEALGVLEGDEVRRFKELSGEATPEAREEAAALRETGSALGLSVDPIAPPPAVREGLMKTIRAAAIENPADGSKRTLRSANAVWLRQPIPGLSIQELSLNEKSGHATVLFRLAPGTVLPSHAHHGPEECYVVAGSVRLGDIALRAGDFHHAEPGSAHGAVVSDDGCTLLLVIDQADYYHAA